MTSNIQTMESIIKKDVQQSQVAILFVSNVIPEHVESEFNCWYQEEHIPERMAIKGFRTAVRYKGLAAKHSYLAIYECDAIDVFEQPVYLERLINPTVRTQKIMPYFKNMVRSICHRTLHEEAVASNQAMYLVFHRPEIESASQARDWIQSVLRDYLFALDANIRISLWEAADGAVASSSPEEKLRGTKDRRVGWVVFIQSADIHAVDSTLTIPLLLEQKLPVGLRLDYISGPYDLM